MNIRYSPVYVVKIGKIFLHWMGGEVRIYEKFPTINLFIFLFIFFFFFFFFFFIFIFFFFCTNMEKLIQTPKSSNFKKRIGRISVTAVLLGKEFKLHSFHDFGQRSKVMLMKEI